MSSGLGVTYELEFIIKDKKALNAIKDIMKNAQKLVSTLDKVSLKEASKQAQNFKADIKQTADSVKNLNKELGKSGKRVKNPVSDVKKGADEATKSVKNLNKNIDKALGNIGKGALYKIGSFLTQQFGQAISDFSSVDFNIRAASAKTGGYGGDYKELLQLGNKVGGETTFTNADVAKAINSGATLGIKKEEMKNIIPASADLAQAFNIEDLSYAVETVRMQMNAYGLSGENATKVTDMISVTAKNTAADIERLREGFKYSGTSAKQLNVPLETTYALLGKLNDNNIIGSSAGTAINEMFKSLANFKKRGQLEELIGSVVDEKGNLKDVIEIMERLKGVTDKMGTADKASVLQTIFGTRGGRAVGTLLNNDTLNQVKTLQGEIKNSEGMTKHLSSFMMSGSGGAIERLLSTLESTFHSVLDSLAPLVIPVSAALMGLLQVIIWINQKVPFLGQLVAIILALGVGKVIFGLLATKLIAFTVAIKDALIKMVSINGVFSVTKALLMGGLVIALIIAFNLLQKWNNYLSQNAEANKEWQSVLAAGKKVLGSLLGLITEFAFALFGLSKKQREAKEGDNVVKTLKNLRKNIEKFGEKVEKTRKWIEENGKQIQDWGKVILVVIGIVKGLSIAIGILNLVMATNPIVLIIMGIVTSIYFLWTALNWLYNNVEWFKDGVNAAWDFIKEHWQTVVGFILGGPIGALIGGLVELYNENEDFKNFADSAWKNIQEIFKVACDVIVELVKGITKALEEAGGAFTALMNADWKGLENKTKRAGKSLLGGLSKSGDKFNEFIWDKMGIYYKGKYEKQKAAREIENNYTGTDYFSGRRSNGMTTVDEHGDEAIWLPDGSMIARNTTTRDMVNTLKSIKNNTRSGAKGGGTTIVQHNNFYVKATDSRGTANEILSEIEKLGLV